MILGRRQGLLEWCGSGRVAAWCRLIVGPGRWHTETLSSLTGCLRLLDYAAISLKGPCVLYMPAAL